MKKILYALYPFFIACFPILALRNHNLVYVDLAAIFRSLILAILITAILWLALRLVFRDWAKAGIATSLAMIVLLSYGHLHIQSEELFGTPIRHSYLLSILAILYLILLWLALRTAASMETSRNVLAVTALALVVMNLGQSLYYDYGTYQAKKVILSQNQQSQEQRGASNLPDIYLIVLDAHARHDVVKNNFGYDNSAFIDELENLGFYVARCSQSNYASTNLSLSSMFNMNYIPAGLGDKAKLPPLKETTLRNTLSSLGYTVIMFENRASGHFDMGEDIRLSENQLLLGRLNLTGGLNEFEEELIQTSILKLFWDTGLIPGFSEHDLKRLENYEHYQQTEFILSKLKDVPQMKSPKFVFVHVLVPHAPYIFTADGKFKNVEDKIKDGYGDNVAFIDQSILPALQSIIAESEQPPIIVLMGDHGPATGKYATREDRMENLNAYFVNEETARDLYDSITPVNSFRIIFNHYFGASYPLLEDVSHYAFKLKQLDNAPIVQNTCTPTE